MTASGPAATNHQEESITRSNKDTTLIERAVSSAVEHGIWNAIVVVAIDFTCTSAGHGFNEITDTLVTVGLRDLDDDFVHVAADAVLLEKGS